MNKLVIFGLGELAEVADFYFSHDSEYDVACFSAHREYIRDVNFMDRPVVPFEEICDRCSPDEYDMFVAVGYSGMNQHRRDICDDAKQKGYQLASYISSKAITWPGFSCGENCFILEQNNIQPFVEIGNNVVMWSANHIGHHSVIEDNVYLASHVVISGRVTVGANSFLGVNATVRDNVTIGKRCLVGAASYVARDLEDNSILKPVQSQKTHLTSDMVNI